MPRPLPIVPRGPRRRRRDDARPLLLACPRVCPQWELDALQALIKPQLKNRIEHRASAQAWPNDAGERVSRVVNAVRQRIGLDVAIHLPAEGDYLLAASILPEQRMDGRGLALAMSAEFPELWFVFGRLFLRGGRFFRRQRGVKLKLVPATDIHLTRPLRATLRDLI